MPVDKVWNLRCAQRVEEKWNNANNSPWGKLVQKEPAASQPVYGLLRKSRNARFYGVWPTCTTYPQTPTTNNIYIKKKERYRSPAFPTPRLKGLRRSPCPSRSCWTYRQDPAYADPAQARSRWR